MTDARLYCGPKMFVVSESLGNYYVAS